MTGTPEAATAYPLSWPAVYPRAAKRKRAPFTTSFAAARDGLAAELRLMRATGIIVSSNVPLLRSGKPTGARISVEDPGVAAYFTWHEQAYCIACDRWDQPAGNLQAIRKSVEALRGLDRWGTSEMLKAAFAGFLALPPVGGSTTIGGGIEAPWWEVLGVSREATLEEISEAFTLRARQIDLNTPEGHEFLGKLAVARRQGWKAQKFIETVRRDQ